MKFTRFGDIPQFTQDGHYQVDLSLDELVRKIDEDFVPNMGLNIDPDFQRLHVWTEAQQIAWLEFFLRGGKTGRIIYLNHPGWMTNFKGEFVLVDGKQRLQAARRFLNNEIPAFGSYYKEYTDRLRMASTFMKLNVNTLKTRADVLTWYIEFNAGGTPHTPEEIAKAQRLLEEELKRRK